MVWSEYTSGDVLGQKGIMGTHDMETYNRFKNTKVHCALAPREISVKEFTDFLQNEFREGRKEDIPAAVTKVTRLALFHSLNLVPYVVRHLVTLTIKRVYGRKGIAAASSQCLEIILFYFIFAT